MTDPEPLDRLQVTGFKSIAQLDVRLKDLNILIGANGAGKSNFIGVFRFVHEILRKNLHDTSESAKVKQPGRIGETDMLLPQADNLAAFLRSIRETLAYRLIVQTIQRVAPLFQDFVLEPEKDNLSLIRLRWRHRGADETFDASDFSDGLDQDTGRLGSPEA